MEMDGDEEAAASWWKLMMIETAKEELELLESKHPNQFEFFKIELKSLIPPTSSGSVATQASTSRVKRKREVDRPSRRRRRLSTSTRARGGFSDGILLGTGAVVEDESVQVALERAKACLQKIRDFKTRLLIC